MERLDEILTLLAVQISPKYIEEELREGIIAKDTNKKEIEKYFELLTWVKNMFRKVQRYEIFFAELYPNKDSKLNLEDVLEYHIHNYISDLYILREKICHYLGTLKNDLKKVAKNKKEIDQAISFLIGETRKNFVEVENERNPHIHRGGLYLDPGVIESRAMRMLLENQKFFPREWNKETAIRLIAQKKENSFIESRKLRIEMATKNSKNLDGLIEKVLGVTQQWLYQYLNLESVSIPKINKQIQSDIYPQSE